MFFCFVLLKILVYKECKTLLKDMIRLVCDESKVQISCSSDNQESLLQSPGSENVQNTAPLINPNKVPVVATKIAQSIDSVAASPRPILEYNQPINDTSCPSLPREMISLEPASNKSSLISDTVPSNSISSEADSSDNKFSQSGPEEKSLNSSGTSCENDDAPKPKQNWNEFFEKCSCNAFTHARGGVKNNLSYTTNDLLLALNAVFDGFSISAVAVNFNIPKSTIAQYTSRYRTLTVRHHYNCNLFSSDVSDLTSGFVVHTRSKGGIRNLHLRKDLTRNNQTAISNASTNNPVVVLDRNEAINGKTVNELSSSSDSLVPNDNSESQTMESLQSSESGSRLASNKADTTQPNETPSNQQLQIGVQHSSIERPTVSSSGNLNNGFGFTKEQLNRAWKTCCIQKSSNKSDPTTCMRQALLMAAKGMSFEHVRSLCQVDINNFNDFVRHLLTLSQKKVRAPRKIIVEPRCRKYSFMQLLHGLDELCYVKSGNSINNVSRKFNIPYSTLKDCYLRNTAVYDSLINRQMTKRERIAVLKRNIDKLRVNMFGSKVINPHLQNILRESVPKNSREVNAGTENSSSASSANAQKPSINTFSFPAASIPTQQSLPPTSNLLHEPSQCAQLSSTSSSSLSKLELAVEEARQTGYVGLTAEKYGVSYALLQRKLSECRPSGVSVLDYIIEKELPFALKILTSWGWSFTLKDIKKLVSDYLFKQKDWVMGTIVSDIVLLSLCQIYSISCEESTSVPDSSVNPLKMASFNDKLLSLLDTHNIKEYPSHVYLLQEYSNFKTSQCNESQPIDQIRYRVVAAMNAAGEKHPPLLIFNDSCLWCTYDDSYPGSQYALARNCEFTPVVFQQWIENFCSKTVVKPLLLLYDGELTKLPLELVRKLYEDSCVILKLPYSTVNTSLKLPYVNLIADAYGNIANDSSTIAKVVSSTNIVWRNLKSETICKVFYESGFFPENSQKSLTASEKLSDEVSAMVEFKAPLQVISRAAPSTSVVSLTEPFAESDSDLSPLSSLKKKKVVRKLLSPSQSPEKTEQQFKKLTSPSSAEKTPVPIRKRAGFTPSPVKKICQGKKKLSCSSSPAKKLLQKKIGSPTSSSAEKLQHHRKKIGSPGSSVKITQISPKMQLSKQHSARKNRSSKKKRPNFHRRSSPRLRIREPLSDDTENDVESTSQKKNVTKVRSSSKLDDKSDDTRVPSSSKMGDELLESSSVSNAAKKSKKVRHQK